jgi:urea transport system permease protein
VNITKTLISENFPEIWSYFIGAIFVLVVLFLPRGVMGICVDVKNLIKGKLGQKEQKK